MTTAEPLSPLRIATSSLLAIAGVMMALLARATYGRGGDLAAIKQVAIALYAGAALGMLVAAIPVANGRRWATRVAAVAAAAPAILWLARGADSGAPAGVYAFAAGFLGLAVLALACARRIE